MRTEVNYGVGLLSDALTISDYNKHYNPYKGMRIWRLGLYF